MNRKSDRMSQQLSIDSITSDTLAKYESSWGHWRLFCERRVQADGSRHGPWLSGTDREMMRALEWAASTTRGKVAAVRFVRTCYYHPGPVAGNPRVKATSKALEKRAREPTQVKMLATRGVVVAVMARLYNDPKHSQGDNGTVGAAMQTGWLFLLRSSEFYYVDGGVHDYCLRLGDVAFYDKDNKKLSSRDAQRALSMSIVSMGSKTDQARV